MDKYTDEQRRLLYRGGRPRRRHRRRSLLDLASEVADDPLANFPLTSILDSFDRANEGPPPSGSWTTPANQSGLKVLSNACGTDVEANSGAAMWSAVFQANQEVHARVAAPLLPSGQYFTLIIRNQSATDWLDSYWAEFHRGTPDVVTVKKYVGGATTTLVDQFPLGSPMVVGMRLGLRGTSSLLTVWRDGTRILSVNDSSILGAGRLIVRVSHDQMALDDFGGGGVG